MQSRTIPGGWAGALAAFAATCVVGVGLAAGNSPCTGGESRTYTTNADFDEGTLVNLNHDVADQLQINRAVVAPYPFINIAATGHGTVVRIDVNTGQILGEYRSAPQGYASNPSRTTVDKLGNVWCGDRVKSRPSCIVKIGLVVGGTRGRKNADGSFTPDPTGQYLAPPFSYNTCVDRDGDGLIKTSRGLGNILAWPAINDTVVKPDGAPALVQDAEDEAILVFQILPGTAESRHVSVGPDNNIWVGGLATSTFWKLDNATGARIASFSNGAYGVGGYGGFIDSSNILWSASSNCSSCDLLRFDLNTMTGRRLPSPYSYGLAIDTNGFVWNARYSDNRVRKFAHDGTQVGDYYIGASGARGLAVSPADNHVWVAASTSNRICRLNNAGTVLKTIAVGSDPTGVAVDSNLKIWVTNNGSGTVMRIDPNGGADGLGAVDLTVTIGGSVYNYSDMTGTQLTTTYPSGTWTVVHDGGTDGKEWGCCSWTSQEPAGTGVTVRVRGADTQAGLSAKAWQPVTNGGSLIGLGIIGRFVQVEATLSRPQGSEVTPILEDLTIAAAPRFAIDIEPNRTPNSICLDRPNTVYVAVLGSTVFDVRTLNNATVRFGRSGVEAQAVRPPIVRDVTGDGIDDALFGFRIADCGFVPGDTSGWLKGQLLNGTNVMDDDAIDAMTCPVADADGDGDVDISDFGRFQLCFNGANRPPTQAGCDDADFDDDNDVDLADYQFFQACYNGPNNPAACPG